MFRNIINAIKSKDIRKKLLITLGILFVYRVGCYLPIPGINPEVFWNEVNSGNQLLNLMSAITGSALQNAAFLAIGISPYINASIIVQLLGVAIPKFEKWQKQGEEGKKKITAVTRVATVILAAVQAVGVAINMDRSGAIMSNIFGINTPAWLIIIFVVMIMIAGAMLTMWLGDRITELGIGNGISLLIFIGIIATTGQAIFAQITTIARSSDNIAAWELGMFLALVLVIFTLIVLVDSSERRISVQYAKQVKGRKLYGGQSTHIPIKLNASGVLPIIFATALITFPQLLAQLIAPGSTFEIWWNNHIGAGTWAYSLLVGLLILFFSFFYSKIQFNPDEVARNIQQYGGFIPGIRAGKPTAAYLKKVSGRLTLFGAIYLALIATIPSIVFALINFGGNMVNAFTATGMMIVVSVAIELDQQIESQLMMKHYKGFLK